MPKPRGRPLGAKGDKSKIITDAIRLAVNGETADEKGKRVKRLRLLAEALVDKAIAGDVQAIKEIGDRLEGRAAQGITVSGNPDAPLVCEVSFRSGV